MDYASFLQTRHRAASDEAIADLGRIATALPPDFEAFLRISDGGVLKNDVLAFQTPWGPHSSPISNLFPINGDGADIINSTKTMHRDGYLPPVALVVADDPGGNLLVLSCEEGPDFGAVYFWHHERASSEQAHTDKISDFEYSLTRIAKSFNELLQSKCLTETDALQMFDSLADAPRPAVPTEPADKVSDAQGSVGPEEPRVLHYKAMCFDLRPTAFAEVSQNDATPMADGWSPREADWNPHAYYEDFDLLEASQSVALRPEVLDVIGDLFRRYGEFLEFTTPTGPIHYFRCLNIVDALSPKTKIQKIDENVYINDPTFVAAKLAGAGIFTLPQQPRKASLYFHEDIAAEIASSGIRHRRFLDLWQAYEPHPPKEQPV